MAASPLFASPDADIVLRSADGVDFRVHRAVLSEASPVFASMFTLPQPPTKTSSAAGATVASPRPLPVVDMSESGETLDALLRLCYPQADNVAGPTMQLNAVAHLIQTARKYDMQQALARAAKLLTPPGALDDALHALRVFAVASDLGVQTQAEEAARASLRAPMGKDLPHELDSISPASLYRLLGYRQRVHAAVVQYLTHTSGWKFASAMDIDLREWGSLLYSSEPDALAFPLNVFRGSHDHDGEPDPYMLYPEMLPHIRVDQSWVIEDLVEQAEQVHKAFDLRLPDNLADDIYGRVDCEECEEAARDFFEGFSECLQDDVREVMMEVPLDRPDSESD